MLFTEILSSLNVSYKRAGEGGHTRDGWVNFACPFCGGGSHKDSMGYNLSKNYVTCYRCGAHSLASTVVEIARIPYAVAKKMLGDLDRAKDLKIERRGKLVLPHGLGPLEPAHRNYLEGRGFDVDAVVKLYHLQAIGHAVELKWRIYIPWEYEGETVSWNTRAIGRHATVRYLGAKAEEESVNRKTLLYAEDLVRGHAIGIVEGELDAWAGGPGFTATGGIALSRAQVGRMAKYLKRVICFDNEPTAQQRARKLADELSAFDGETLIVQCDSKDLASTDAADLQSIRKLLT